MEHRIAILAITIAGCAGEKLGTDTAAPIPDLWAFSDVHTAMDQDGYVVARGSVTLNLDETTPGATTETRFYSANYETLLDYIFLIVGPISYADDDVDDAGRLDAFTVRDHLVYLLPRTGGQSEVCLWFQADDSNYASGAEIGCESAVDP